MKHYCYMLRCADGTLYTGYTTDLTRREKSHNAGTGAKYTRARRPCHMVYYEEYATKEEAMSREYEIKHSLTKAEKEKLVADFAGKDMEADGGNEEIRGRNESGKPKVL